ncbi:DnaB-like helicase C-terminal domain-containing protein [Consotaella aegiceratis]|uniref:DnaB-like helicase C-terminal domain-containing protein n=1 Tax=Consotaella aegiceratis TaxID=3097961 RepID=UPI002F3F960C
MNDMTHDFSADAVAELEQVLLGAFLMDNGALDAVPFLEPEHFYDQVHQDIFRLIRSLVAKGRRADPMILRTFFDPETKVGEISIGQYLSRLAAEAGMPGLVRDYALGVIEDHASRFAAAELEDHAKRFLRRDPADSISGLCSSVEDAIGKVRSLAPTVQDKDDAGSAVDAVLHELSPGANRAGQVIPVPIPELADLLDDDGLRPGNLYGLLGASSEGKTSLTLQIARHVCELGHPCLILSYDQTPEQIARQMMTQETSISVPQILRASLNEHEAGLLSTSAERIRVLPLKMRRMTNQKMGTLCGIARRWVDKTRKTRRADGREWGAPLIILDHVSAVTPDDPRADAGSKASNINRQGKALAEELGAACWFLNQRNGEGSRRFVPRPIAADLYGGEAARQDYDSVLYVYRPERWRDEQLRIAKDEKEAEQIRNRFRLKESFDATPMDPEGKAEIGTIKGRYGGMKMAIVEFEARFTRYRSMRRQEQELPF